MTFLKSLASSVSTDVETTEKAKRLIYSGKRRTCGFRYVAHTRYVTRTFDTFGENDDCG